MNKIIKGLMFILAVGFSGLSSASTVTTLYSQTLGAEINASSSLDVSIGYDSSDWASINSATLSVKLIDDSDLSLEFADISDINGQGDPGVSEVEVGKWLVFPDWYWNIDVSSYLNLGVLLDSLDFTLVSNEYDILWWSVIGDYKFLNAKLTVDYNEAPNAVPVPAALFLFAPALLGFLGLRRKAQA